jgi:hypothetical protein
MAQCITVWQRECVNKKSKQRVLSYNSTNDQINKRQFYKNRSNHKKVRAIFSWSITRADHCSRTTCQRIFRIESHVTKYHVVDFDNRNIWTVA